MTPFGDRAVRFAVPTSVAERRALLARLRPLPGVRDVVLCETVGAVVFEDHAERALVAVALATPLAAVHLDVTEHVVPVIYDGEDLETVARAIGRAPEDVVRLHTGATYDVAMLGFLPGFAYLRGLEPALRLPRRAPRPRVPASSVAIGAEYTGVYPRASAGGWHLLGRALATPPFELGDRVRFEVTSETRPSNAREPTPAPEPPPQGAHLVVTRVAGLASLIDEGRSRQGGQMHRGMPPGGPLVRRAFARTDAPRAIELTGRLEVEARGGDVAVTTSTHGEATTLREGERFTLASGSERVVYLAVRNGFAEGLGRPLRRGDLLSVAHAPRPRSSFPHTESGDTPEGAIVLLRAGPDLTDELRSAIEAADFSISPTSDRAGTRLVGPSLPSPPGAGTRASTPMVEGAIELTPSGLLVLGPDHPTTGGYPVPAIVAESSRDAFFVRPLGASLRFTFR